MESAAKVMIFSVVTRVNGASWENREGIRRRMHAAAQRSENKRISRHDIEDHENPALQSDEWSLNVDERRCRGDGAVGNGTFLN